MGMAAGTRLGSYTVVGHLGVGGMGEVYRAQDSTLGREVALKVLPEALSHDADRLARFEREARVLASLSHPNIAVLHGFERATPVSPKEIAAETQTGEIAFLVMELVEGETLAERIAKGPLPWREAVTVLDAIADGLKAAHERGIVHRDLKPANVKIDTEARVKVLDFGLARSSIADTGGSGAAVTQSPTLTAATGMGVLLGTAAYMSPEQARGLVVDRRADVWAFGVCLFETLAGRRPFEGEDISLTLAAVLSQEVDWSLLPDATPAAIRSLLERCFEKDPRQRLQDLGDAQWWLRKAEEPSVGDAAATLHAAAGRRGPWWWAIAAAALAGGIAVGMLLGRGGTGGGDVRPAGRALRFIVATEEASAPARVGRGVAASPSGMAFAYAASGPSGSGVYVYELDQGRSRFVAGTEGGAAAFFSHDGARLGFARSGALYQVPIGGGLAQFLCELPVQEAFLVGVGWGPDVLVFAVASGGIMKLPAMGGAPQPIPGEVAARAVFPVLLPGGEHVLASSFNPDRIHVLRLDTGEEVDLGTALSGQAPQYLDSGHLVFAADETLWSVPFDAAAIKVTGPPRSLDGLPRATALAAPFSTSTGGTLILSAGGSSSRLVAMDADGTRHDLGAQPGVVRHPRLSPDGGSIAYTRGGIGSAQIWIREMATGREVRLAEGMTVFPTWTNDGRIVYFQPTDSAFGDLAIVSADRSGEAERLLTHRPATLPADVSAEGVVLFGQDRDIWRLSLGAPAEAAPWLATPAFERNAEIAPGGEWVAYESDTSGRSEVYLRPLDGQLGELPVSVEGGRQPAWSHDGRTLFYRGPRGLEAVDVDPSVSPPRLGAARFLTELTGDDFSGQRTYDPTPDGGFIAAEAETSDSRFRIVYNLGAELRSADGTTQ